MCKFQVSIVCVDEGNDTNKKLQVEIFGNSVSPPLEPLFTNKLASFQVLDHKSFLLNVYKDSKDDRVCDSAQSKSQEDSNIIPSVKQNQNDDEKIVKMLHINKDKSSDDKSSRQDLHTKLISKCKEHGAEKYIGRDKKHDSAEEKISNSISSVGRLLQTVVINLDDWTSNQRYDFHVNTLNSAQIVAPSELILIPFGSSDQEEGAIKNGELYQESKSNITDEPIRMQVVVANSLILTLQSSLRRIYAHELNNNQGISSAKARNHISNLLFVSVVRDEGFPIVPTRKQIIRELIRERLRSLKMGESEANKFLDTRENEFIQHRSLSVRLPLITRPNVTTSEVTTKEKPSSLPLSVSFEIEARYQTLIHHSDNLNKIVNSAAVSAIEGSIYFILPHITMTPVGSKLNHVSPSLVEDWLDVIYTAAYQLKPTDPCHVKSLVEREMKQVTRCSEELLKNSRKTLIKCKKLNDIVLKKYKKARLPKINWDKQQQSTTTNSQNNYGSDPNSHDHFPMKKADVGYSQFLQKMGVSASKLYPNHVYIAVGKYGVLLKKTMRNSWFLFDDLNYPERRVIFLGLMEHMQETIRAVAAAIRRIQELYVDGYPANVHNHLNIVFKLIRDMNRFDLTDVMKANVLNQGVTIVESTKRIVTVVHEIYAMAKVTYAKFHATYYDPDDAQRYKVRKPDSKAARIQLIVPFSALATEGLAALKFRTEDAKDYSTTTDNATFENIQKELKADMDLPIFEKVNLF